ncbi:MAG: hypothetical protein OEZ14_16795 [Acidimicrobiia bacterium]|nr:hypothetical protein [Acidimicrobiia bacterium]MDH5522181.1 hypothetical protein [Acidimicrobiia bacterium]
MMNKTLLSLGLATALIASAGTAVAAQGSTDATTPTTAAVADRDRDQLHDCDLYDRDALQVQDRDRDQLRDPALVDGDPSTAPERVRNQARLGSNGENGEQRAEFTGGNPGAGFGEGVLDGTGPVHEGPADGTGNQFGRGDR